ncbi:hypothetical protein GDO81_023419 [Engystomops pustulosus]|uniref:Uncharacterized protein n=1 Tax=Engystomops pustulosus TaxID=76066 RepID=A0AAV6YSR6_ENGPU|nr:hypothetical protein GDO81_023419 [Engystomops pustulosus]
MLWPPLEPFLAADGGGTASVMVDITTNTSQPEEQTSGDRYEIRRSSCLETCTLRKTSRIQIPPPLWLVCVLEATPPPWV